MQKTSAYRKKREEKNHANRMRKENTEEYTEKKVKEIPSPNLFNWGHLCEHCKQSLSQK